MSHVNATIHLFGAASSPQGFKCYMDVHRLFKRGEVVSICKSAMAKHGPMDTRELSHHVMKAKGFHEDNELR